MGKEINGMSKLDILSNIPQWKSTVGLLYLQYTVISFLRFLKKYCVTTLYSTEDYFVQKDTNINNTKLEKY